MMCECDQVNCRSADLKLKVKIHYEPKVCVIARTYQRHGRETLQGFIFSLLAGSRESRVNIKIFLLRTDPADSEDYLVESVLGPPVQLSEFVKLFPHKVFLSPVLPAQNNGSANNYGYVSTDLELARLRQARKSRNRNRPLCNYYLITNGDNFYSAHLWKYVLPEMQKKTDLVAFSFACHHTQMRPKRVEIKRKFIDLGAALISNSCLDKTGAKFLPDEGLTQENMFAADFFFFESISKNCTHVELENLLLFHQ